VDNPQATGTAPAGPDAEFEKLYERAQQHLNHEEFEEANKAFADALNLSPRHAGALSGLAVSLRKLDKYEEAQHVLNRALFLHPNNEQLLMEQGALCLHRRNYEKALEVFVRLPLGIPESEAALKGKAESLRRLKRYDEASQAILQALQSFPQSRIIRTEQAYLLAARDRFDESIEAFLNGNDESALIQELQNSARTTVWENLVGAATRRLPKSLSFLNLRAGFFLQEQQYDKALEAFQSALAIDSSNAEAHLGRAEALRKLARFEEAVKAINEALTMYPQDPRMLREKACLYYDHQKYDEAVEVLLEKDHEDGLITFVKSHFDGIDFNKAPDPAVETFLQAAIARLPKNEKLLQKLGEYHLGYKQYSQAAEVFGRAAEIYGISQDSLQEILTQKIQSLRLAGSVEEAYAAIAGALYRLPGNKAVIAERAWLFYQRKEYDSAVSDFVEAGEKEVLRKEITSLRGKLKLEERARLIEAALTKLDGDVQLWVERGWRYYEDQRQFENALNSFDEALKIDPDHEDALEGKCAILRLERKFPEAQAAIEEGLRRHAESRELLIQLGWLQHSQWQLDKAIATFDRILKTHPYDQVAIQSKILALKEGDRIPEAEEVANEALGKDASNAVFLCERGRLYYERDDFQKAEEHYSKAIAADPDYLDAYFNRVEVLKRLNRSDEALKMLEGLKKARPDDMGVIGQLGWFVLGAGNSLRARQELESLLRLDPKSSFTSNYMGVLAFFEERYDDAEAEFQKALKLELNNDMYHSNLAWALVRQMRETRSETKSPKHTWLESLGQSAGVIERTPANASEGLLREAEEHCRAALQISPNSTDAYGCLGIIAFKRGRLIESEDFFKKSIEIDAKEGNYVDLGALYAQMGRYDEALIVLEKARTLDRTDMRARLELGNVYLQTEKLKEAIHMFREAMAASPDSPEPPRALALGLMRNAEFTEAGRVLRKAIRYLDQSKRWQLHLALCQLLSDLADKNDDQDLYNEALKEASTAILLKPEHASPYFYAGLVRYKLEDYGRALKHFRECLKRDPDHFDAEQNARRVRALLQSERVRAQSGLYVGAVLGTMCAGLLATLWILYFKTDKIKPTMLGTLSPILLGLIFVAFLMPWLSKLKLPGVEAELSRPKEKVSTGPTGSVSFGSSSLSAGPQ